MKTSKTLGFGGKALDDIELFEVRGGLGGNPARPAPIGFETREVSKGMPAIALVSHGVPGVEPQPSAL